MVAGIGIGNLGIFAALLPVKFTGVYDDTAKGGSVTADKLGGGMNHDIRTMLDGSDQIGGTEGVVDDHRQSVSVCQS